MKEQQTQVLTVSASRWGVETNTNLDGRRRGLSFAASQPSIDDLPHDLEACVAFGQRWIVHHDELLEAVVLLGEMLGVDWEDG